MSELDEDRVDEQIETIKSEIELRLGVLAQYLDGNEVLAYVERIAERMHEELAGRDS